MAGPLYRQIADQIRRQIESGDLRAGMQIPAEDQLMKQYHTSRNTVRGALRELTTRGLVYTLHGKGSYVSERVAPIVITLTIDPETGHGGGEGLVYTAEVAASGRLPEMKGTGGRNQESRTCGRPLPANPGGDRGHRPVPERLRGRTAMVTADLVLSTEPGRPRPAAARHRRNR
jgi:DNA-binding transcriptional MocR family regulator